MYFIISGQHRFEAAKRFRREREEDHKPIPLWCRRFTCDILKPDVTVDFRERIAGRLQSSSLTTLGWSFTETMEYLVQLASKFPEDRRPPRTDLLRVTYEKTGKNEMHDGGMVCVVHGRSTDTVFSCIIICSRNN